MKKLVVLLVLLSVFFFNSTAMGIETLEGHDLFDGQFHIIDDDTYSVGLNLDRVTMNAPGTHIDLVAGGVLRHLWLFNNATATVIGGSNVESLMVFQNGKITLIGSDFEVTDLDGITTDLSYGNLLSDFGTIVDGYYTGTITGTLADGSALNNEFRINNSGGYAGTADIIIIPEPATLLLLGMGGLLIRKR